MNRIEKAGWAARLRRRDAGERAGAAAAVWASPVPVWGHFSPHRRGPGLWGGASQPGHSASSGLPFICWLCHFLSIADPFSVPSVILNNVTVSLESIHQSRKKPMLTLIKKKYHLCLTGEELSTQPLVPLPPLPPALLPFHRVPRGNQILLGAGGAPTGGAPTPTLTLLSQGEMGSKRGLNPRRFSVSKKSLIWASAFLFFNWFFFIG